jgi:Zn-dependent peptidase ImmA (M78 family)
MERYDPYKHAAELDIPVIHRRLLTANGMWLPRERVIVVQTGLRAVHDRSALAHEVAHALLGHVDDRPKSEVQADRLASENMIDLDECRDVMRWAPDFHLLARELEVSPRLLRTFLNVHRLAG